MLKHSHIGEAFFDRDAASFLLRELAAAQACERRQQQHQTLRAEEEEEKEESAWADSSGAGAACQPSRQAAGASGGGRSASPTSGPMGHAVGPKWTERLQEQQRQVGRGGTPARVTLEYNALVTHVVAGDSGTGATAETTPEGDAPAARPQHPAGDEASEEAPTAAAPSAPSSAGSPNGRPWPVTVHLSSGALIGADFVVSAIGVEPCTEWVAPEVQRAPDGGLWVDARMATTSCGVYAAGDACTVRPEAVGPHWFQMRLWTQARVMGTHAARCIAGRADDLGSGFAFELFTHVTRFFGKKVVLLGLYNGQRLEKEAAGDIVMYSRDEPPEGFDSGGSGSGAAVARHRAGGGGGCCGSGGGAQDASVNSFVRVLLLRGRLQGAVLIGETDLEETLENLILDGLDLSGYGPHLLDPDVELDHVFD